MFSSDEKEKKETLIEVEKPRKLEIDDVVGIVLRLRESKDEPINEDNLVNGGVYHFLEQHRKKQEWFRGEKIIVYKIVPERTIEDSITQKELISMRVIMTKDWMHVQLGSSFEEKKCFQLRT